jgi:hypothetical protein
MFVIRTRHFAVPWPLIATEIAFVSMWLLAAT